MSNVIYIDGTSALKLTYQNPKIDIVDARPTTSEVVPFESRVRAASHAVEPTRVQSMLRNFDGMTVEETFSDKRFAGLVFGLGTVATFFFSFCSFI